MHIVIISILEVNNVVQYDKLMHTGFVYLIEIAVKNMNKSQKA